MRLTVNSGTGDGNYAQGAVVNIAADAPPQGYAFDEWTGGVAYVADVNSANTTVTMPAAAVTVTATYLREQLRADRQQRHRRRQLRAGHGGQHRRG